MEKILKFINQEIEIFKKEKERIPEKYRDVEITIKNQELRINSTLATLKSVKGHIEEGQKGVKNEKNNY